MHINNSPQDAQSETVMRITPRDLFFDMYRLNLITPLYNITSDKIPPLISE